MPASALHVRLGVNFIQLQQDTTYLNDYDIATVIIHERFSLGVNDIALMKLARPAEYSIAIQPICIPTENMKWELFENTHPTVAGWGATQEGMFSTELSF